MGEIVLKSTVSQLLESSMTEWWEGRAWNWIKDSNRKDSESLICCLTSQKSCTFKKETGAKLCRSASEELRGYPVPASDSSIIEVWVEDQP